MFSSALSSVSGTDGYGYVPTVLPVPANPVPENTVSDALLFLTDDTTSYLTRSVSLVRKVASRMGTMIVSTEFTHGPRKERIVVSYFADHLPLLFANGVAVEEKDHVVPLTVAYSVERLLLSLIRLEIVPPNVYRRVMEADTDDSAQKEIDDLVRSSEFWKIVNFVVSLKVNDKFHPLFTNMDVFVDAGRISSQIRNLRIEYWKEVRNYAISTWKTVPESVQPAGSKINEQAIGSVMDSLLDDVVTAERMELEKREWIPVSSQLGSFPKKGCTFEPEVKLSKKQRRRANAKLNKVEIGSQKRKIKASEAWAIQEVCGIDVTEVALSGVPVENEGEKEGVAVQSVQSPPKEDPLVSNVEKEGRVESTMEKGPEPVGFSFSANSSSTSSVFAPRSTDFSFSAANSPCPSTSPLAAPRSTDFSFSAANSPCPSTSPLAAPRSTGFSFSANSPSTSSVAAPRSTEFSFPAKNPSTSPVTTPRSTVGLVFNKSALSFSAQRPSTSSIFGASKTPIQKGLENPTSATFTSFPIRKGLFTGISGNVTASTEVTTNPTDSVSTTPVAPFAAYRGKSSFEPGASNSQLNPSKPSSIFGTGVPNFRSFASAAGSVTFFDLQQSDQKATSAGTEPPADASSEKTSEVDASLPAGSKGGIAPVVAVSPTVSIDRDVVVTATSLNIPAECTASTGSEAAPAPNLRHTISITSSSVVAATTSESTSLSSPEKPSEASPTAAAETTLSSGFKDGPAPVPEVSSTIPTSTHIVEASTASESSTPCLASIPSTSPDLPTKPRAPTVPAEVLPLSTEVLTVDVGQTTSTQPSEVERSPDTRSKQIWTPASEQSSSTTSTSHGKETAPLVTSLLPPPNRRSKTLFGVTLTSNEVPRVELKQIPDIWDSSIKEGWDTFKLLRVFLNKVFGRTGRFLIVTNQLDKCKDKSEGAMYLRLTLTGLEVWPGLYVCVEGSGCQLESAVLLAFLQLVMDVTGLSQLSPYVLDVLHNEKFNELVLNAVIMVLSGCAVHRGTFFVRHFDDVVYRYWPKANGVFRWKLLSLLTNAMRGTASLRGISREANLDLQVVCRTKGGLLGKMGMFERTSPLLISANSIRKISAGPVELSSIVSTSTHFVTAETTSQSLSSSNQSGPSTSVDLPAEPRAPTMQDKVMQLAIKILTGNNRRQHDTQRQDLPTTSTLPSDVERSPDTAHEKCSSTTGTSHEQGTVPLVTSLLPPPNRRSKTLFGVTLTSNEVPRVELKQIPDNWDRSIKEGSDTFRLLRVFLNKVFGRTGRFLIVTNQLGGCKDKSEGAMYLRLTLTGLEVWPGLSVRIEGSGCQLESAVLLAFLQLLMDVTGMSQLSPYVLAVLHNEKLNELVLNAVISVLSGCALHRGTSFVRQLDEVVIVYWQKASGLFRTKLQPLLARAMRGTATLRAMSREVNLALQTLCQTRGALLGKTGMFEYTSPVVIWADSIRKISAGPLDWQEGDDSDVEVVEVPPRPAPEVIDLTDDDVLVVDSPSVVTIPEKNSEAQSVTENTPADDCIPCTSTSCEASSGGSSTMPGVLTTHTDHRTSPTVASSAAPSISTVDAVTTTRAPLETVSGPAAPQNTEQQTCAPVPAVVWTQPSRPHTDIEMAINKYCRENSAIDPTWPVPVGVPTSFSGRRQECGNRTAAVAKAAGNEDHRPKPNSPMVFGVTLTTDEVPLVEMKTIPDSWDHTLREGYDAYNCLLTFVNACLEKTNNTLIVTNQISGFRDLVEGDCYLRLTLSRLVKWPGLFFHVKGGGCQLESAILLAFVQFLMNVFGMSFLSPHAASLIYNESCSDLILRTVCCVLEKCSAHPQQGSRIMCRFDEIVSRYWSVNHGLFRSSLQKLLFSAMGGRIVLLGLLPTDNLRLQQLCGKKKGRMGNMRMFMYTSGAIVSAKSFAKLVAGGDLDNDVEIVEAPGRPISVNEAPPRPGNWVPVDEGTTREDARDKSAPRLPFGILETASLTNVGGVVHIPQFVSSTSLDKSTEEDGLSPNKRKKYCELIRFLNEFLTKTGFSFTGRLTTPSESATSNLQLALTLDQLPEITIYTSWKKLKREAVSLAELVVLQRLVDDIATRTRFQGVNGLFLKRITSNVRATDLVVNYLADMLKELPPETTRKELRNAAARYAALHSGELKSQLEAIAPLLMLSQKQKKRVRKGATVQNSQDVPQSAAAAAVANDVGLAEVIRSVLSETTPSNTSTNRSPEVEKGSNKGSEVNNRSKERSEVNNRSKERTRTRGKRRRSPNRTRDDVPAAKQRRSSPSLPFGLSTAFSSEQSIWHHLDQLPFTANERKLLLADSRSMPAPVMRKQFMNRLLAKTEMNLILEQFSELSSSYCGFVIRLEHIPDSLFRVSYRVDSRTSSEQMEDEIMQTILGTLSGGLPALLPAASASAILHNQKSADYLATYVSGALKSVLARVKSLQGLILAGVLLTAAQMGDNLNGCLTEYWANNENALYTWLQSARNDFSRVPLPPTRGGRQPTGGSSEQGGQPSGSRTMSVAERMHSRLMDKMTSSSSDSARRVHDRSRSRSPRRTVSRERRTSSSRRRRGSSPGERGRRRSRERKRSRSRSRSPPRRRTSRNSSRTSHSRDSSLSSSSSTTSEDSETVSVECAFVECGEEESSQLRRMVVFVNHVADKLKTTLKVVSVPQRDNSTAVRVQLSCVSPLLISGSDKQDSGISLAVRNALYKMFDSVCSVGEVSFAMRQKIMNSNDVAAALGVALQPLFSYLNKSSIKDLEKRLRRCKATEQGKLMKEFHQLSRTNALEFWKEHKDLVTAASQGRMPSPPPLRVPSPVVLSAMAPAEKPGTSISSGLMALDFIPLPGTGEDEEDTEQPFHGAIKQATAPKIQIIAPLALPRTKSPSIHVNPNWLARRTGPETPPVTGVYEQTFGSSLEWPHELFEKAGNALLTTGNDTDTAVVAVKKAGTERADSGPVAGTSRLGLVTEAVFQKPLQDSGREPARPAGQVPPGSIWNLFGPNGNWKDKSAAQAEKRDNSREKLH